MSPGVFDFYTSFRERNITLTSPGYMPYTYRILKAMDKGCVYVMRVRTVGEPVDRAGRGGLGTSTPGSAGPPRATAAILSAGRPHGFRVVRSGSSPAVLVLCSRDSVFCFKLGGAGGFSPLRAVCIHSGGSG